MKKIVAIGGGFIGEINDLGVKQSYETGLFDREIVKLSNTLNPNLLFIGLAEVNYSDLYFEFIKEVYEKKYGCNCKNLKTNDLNNKHKLEEYFKWADIFYVGGGNTYNLMNYLTTYQLDNMLVDASNQGKVMSGISAGGMCWFKYGNSIIRPNPKLIKQKCLGLENIIFVPHCDEVNGHFENVENMLANENMVAISLSNCCALEIVDDKYRFLVEDGSRYNITPFALKSFWLDGKYYINELNVNQFFEPLSNLTSIFNDNKSVSSDVKKLLKKRNIYFK